MSSGSGFHVVPSLEYDGVRPPVVISRCTITGCAKRATAIEVAESVTVSCTA